MKSWDNEPYAYIWQPPGAWLLFLDCRKVSKCQHAIQLATNKTAASSGGLGCSRSVMEVSKNIFQRSGHSYLNSAAYSLFVGKQHWISQDGVPYAKFFSSTSLTNCLLWRHFFRRFTSAYNWKRKTASFVRAYCGGGASPDDLSGLGSTEMSWHWLTSSRIDYMCWIL